MTHNDRLAWLRANPQTAVDTSQYPDEAEAFCSWLAKRCPRSILEIGCRTGSNLYLLAGASADIGVAEGVDLSAEHAEARRLVEGRLRAEGLVAQIHDQRDSGDLANAGLSRWNYDCIYIDGDHRYHAALRDWKQALIHLEPGGAIGFHDTHLYQVDRRDKCAAFWSDAKQFSNRPFEYNTPTPRAPGREMGVGGVGFRKKLLFMVAGGLGDGAEMTRVLLVAAALGHIVHVLPVRGACRLMQTVWDAVPWVVMVSPETARQCHYTAVLGPTRWEALEQRAEGLTYDLLTNGREITPPKGRLIEDWHNCLRAIGESADEIKALTPAAPFEYLLPQHENTDAMQTVLAPGVGSCLTRLATGEADKRYQQWAAVTRLLPRPVTFVGNKEAHEPWMDEDWVKTDQGITNLIGTDREPADMIPLFANTRALFCPDNGVGHLAGLFGVPTISVFNGATDPRKFAPARAIVVEGTPETLPPELVYGHLHYADHPECLDHATPHVTDQLLSVIITSHNEGAEVLLTCRDVYERAGCPVEIVVVDEGSTDGSCNGLPSYCKVVRNPQQTGVAPARNQGVAAATGVAFMFLDAHERVKPFTPAKMLLAAQEKQALIVSGVAPLYNPEKPPLYRCKWDFHAGRLRSKWRSACRNEFDETASFVAPGWCVTRETWNRIGPWPSALCGWGSTEVCKGVQAFMAGVPLIAMREAVTWHRFRARFPYHVSPDRIQANAYVVARVMFGEKLFNEVWFPAMSAVELSDKQRAVLSSPELTADCAAMEARRQVAPEKFMERYFPQGLPKDQAPQPVEAAAAS